MPPLTDAAILAQFKDVLANWNYTGFVTGKAVVLDWVARYLGGKTLKDVAHAMHDHVMRGGVIDQVPETRPEWSVWAFHYDFRFPFGDRNLYVETVLQDDDPSDVTIHVVSLHDV